ncbi:MAG TPA: radical SAM protein [Rhodospirillales bacterium]
MSDRKNVDHIESVKYTDIESVLGEEFGERFRRYRADYHKSLNYDKNGFLPDFPLTVSIELVNRCNLNCVMCYTINHKDPKATFELPDIERLMAECRDNNLPAAVVGMGSEALIYKGVRDALANVRKAGVMDVFLGTNGVLLTEDLSEFLVEQRIARLEISLDAATPETYLKIRRKDELKRIEANIEKLLAVRKRLGSRLPVIRLCFCVQKYNIHEQEAFLKKWQGKVDYIDFQEMVDFGNVSEFRATDGVLDARPAGGAKPAKTYCAYPFNSLHVWSNGDVTPCCTFFGKALVMGNVKRQTLTDIWNGDKMREVRRQLQSGDVNPVCYACLTQRETETFEMAKKHSHKPAEANTAGPSPLAAKAGVAGG